MPRFAPPTITQAQIMAGTVLSAHIGELVRDESGVIWRGVAGGLWERVGDTSSHESTYDHGLIATALQPDDLGTSPGNVVPVIDAQTDPDGDPIPAVPALDARLLTNLPLPAFDADRVAVPATQSSPGIPGQWAEDSAWRYECVAENSWKRWAIELEWETLAFIGPNLSPISAQVGAVLSIDVSGRFSGLARTYSLIDAPAWLSIDASGTISGTAEIGSASFTVRATVGAESVDSNPIAISVSFEVATNFSQYAAGDWSETYLRSNANALMEVVEAGPVNSGKALRTKNNNATDNLWTSEYVAIPAADMGAANWEVLALVRIGNVNCRIGIGYVDGDYDYIGRSIVSIQLFNAEPRFLSLGAAEAGGTLNYTVVDPDEYLNEYVWVNKQRVGNQARYRFWLHGTERPDWIVTRTYADPVSPPATAGLGWFMSHRQTATQVNEIFYFAATVGGKALQVPEWTLPSFPDIAAGELSYLNTWTPKESLATHAQAKFDAMRYPLFGFGDHSGVYPDEVLRSATNLYAATDTRFLAACNPESFRLCRITSQEYQGNLNTIFGNDQDFDALSTYTSVSELKLFPGHVAFQSGTTTREAIVSNTGLTAVIPVHDASKIRVAQHAFWYTAPGNFNTPADWEWVYVTGRDTTLNTITVTRGWKAPLRQTGASLQKAHASGSYLASVTTGGAATAKRAVPGGTPSTANHNWKWNMSTQCPLDSNSTTIHSHLVEFITIGKIAASLPILGAYADGIYDDVDRRSYLGGASGDGELDVDNDGIADFGYSSLTAGGSSLWAAGVAQFEQMLISEIGPGTIYNCAMFVNGTEESDSFLYNGHESEAWPYDRAWRLNQDSTFVKTEQNVLNAIFNTQIESGFGPRIQTNLGRVYTAIAPCLQDYTAGGWVADECRYDAVGSNALRLNMAMTWCIGGIMAMPQSKQNLSWLDEYACDAENGYVCPRFEKDGTGDSSEMLRSHTGWMGKPKGLMVRHYDAAQMALTNDISIVDATSAINPLAVSGCSGVRITSGGPSNEAYWRYTQTAMGLQYTACRVNKTFTGLTVGQDYTVVIAMRSDRYRRVQASIATDCSGLHLIGDQWLHFPYTFKATATTQYMAIGFGLYFGRLDIGAWHILPGRSNAFSRDFDRALVLANPCADAYTFTLPVGASYQRLLGTQDPAVNSGAAVTGTVTVPARDGLILAKVL